MKPYLILTYLLTSLSSLIASDATSKAPQAPQSSTSSQSENSPNISASCSDFINDVFTDNEEFTSSLTPEHYDDISHKQSPRATILTCCDSRVQINAFDKDPINDVFLVRDIGNQIATTQGSVTYGIRELKTPIFIVIGHSDCGAIKALLTEHPNLHPSIKKELDTLKPEKPYSSLDQGIVANVERQVNFALKEFDDLIKANKLTVFGMLYDLKNEFNQGYGRLILLSINGEKNPEVLNKHPFLKNVRNVDIGIPQSSLK